MLSNIPWRKVALVLGLLLVIGIIIIVVNQVGKPKEVSAWSSDIVLTNTRSPQSSGSNTLTFFTGSNIAEINLKSPSTGKLESKAQLNETAYQEIQSLSYSSTQNTLLTKVSYTGQSGFFKIRDQPPGDIWFLQKGSAGVAVFNPSNKGVVVDAYISGDVVYALIFEAGAKQKKLLSYTVDGGEIKNIKDTSANKVVGVLSDSVVLRDQKGSVLLVNKDSGNEKKLTTPGLSVYADSETNSVVATNLPSENGTSVLIFDGQGDKKSIKLPYAYVFVSGGIIINTDNNTNPEHLYLYNIKDGDTSRVNVSRINTRLQDVVESMIVINKSPLTITAATSSGSVFVISDDQTYINSFPPYKYPVFAKSLDSTVSISGKVGLNEASILTSLSNIKDTLPVLSRSCACDINQISKTWISTNDLVKNVPDDYTGDGTPPEFQP